MKHRTLQFKNKNIEGKTIGYAMRFPICPIYKAIYRALKKSKDIFDIKIFVWYD